MTSSAHGLVASRRGSMLCDDRVAAAARAIYRRGGSLVCTSMVHRGHPCTRPSDGESDQMMSGGIVQFASHTTHTHTHTHTTHTEALLCTVVLLGLPRTRDTHTHTHTHTHNTRRAHLGNVGEYLGDLRDLRTPRPPGPPVVMLTAPRWLYTEVNHIWP
jgi:hypothetical protein